MTSKERVLRALRRQTVDRIPVFMWFHPETTQRLAGTLEIPPQYVGDVLGNDVRQTWVGNNYAMEGIIHEHNGQTHRDDWGIEWIKVGAFNQILSSPLSGANGEAVRRYEFPFRNISTLVGGMDRVMRGAAEYFVGCDVSPCLFEMICRLRGMEQAMIDLAQQPDLAEDLLEKAAQFACALSEDACRRYNPDWLWTGDDVAGQQALMISPSTWRSLVRPRLARIVQVGKRQNLPVAYHCCGALRPIIPDLITIGIDVLNPIQCKCPGMDPIELKKEFGTHLTFMGGVDTIDLLPKGTPGEVLRQTSSLIEEMTQDGGGYILAASHTVPPETPLENIFALYSAAGIPQEQILDRAADVRRAFTR
jgi:uroporphyrinogen decarboxylase